MQREFHRRARRDKKAFLNEQCKEIEDNNRMEKTSDLKKTRDIKGTFAKMDNIKDRKGKDLTEKKLRRGGKNTQKTIQKYLNDQITTLV